MINGRAARAKSATHLMAVNVGKPEIQQYDVRVTAEDLLHGLGPGNRLGDVETSKSEILGIHFAVVSVVVDNQHAWRSIHV